MNVKKIFIEKLQSIDWLNSTTKKRIIEKVTRVIFLYIHIYYLIMHEYNNILYITLYEVMYINF